LDNVTFRTDKALYDKFKIISTIKKEKVQNVLTKFIEKYVTENEKFIGNSEIQEVIQQELPTFFGNADDWDRYVGKLDNIGYVKMATRFMFLEYLLLYHKYKKQNKYNNQSNEFLTFLENNKESFDTSDDRRHLAKFGIFRSVKDGTNRYGKDLLSVWDSVL